MSGDDSAVTLLVVDDDPAMRRALCKSLAAVGYSVQEAAGGAVALAMLREQPAQLVLLDINMPGLDGVETCRQIRRLHPHTAIVMMTVRDGEEDKVQALDSGADDYITKPFHLRELLARLRAVLRRSNGNRIPLAEVWRVGDLELDLANRTLTKSGTAVHLSPKEFDLLAFLISHQGKAVTHSQILRAVWGPEYGGELEYLRTYMKLLRRKIEDNAAQPRYILTEPWLGYRLLDPSSPDVSSPAGSESEV